MQSRRQFLKTVGAAVGSAVMFGGCEFSNIRDDELPNIIAIFADDLGQKEISCYGRKDAILTANIDSIARNGARFTNFYATNPTCAPCRYSFLTGQYHNRTSTVKLNGRTTIPKVLKARGYISAVIGKWHLNPMGPRSREDHIAARRFGYGRANLAFIPTEHGFDYYYGHWYPTYWCHDKDVTIWRRLVSDNFNIKPWFKSTGELDPPKGYATDLLTNDAVSFIKSTPKKQPFFLWLTYNAPHYGYAIISGKKDLANNEENTFWIEPQGGSLQKGRISGQDVRFRNTLAAKPEDVELFKNTKNRKRRFFEAMVKAMDDGIGQILKTLKETGHDKNTIVIFFSDQGSDETISSAGNNRPFRGAKHTQWEGGVRVPFVAQWPGHIKPGSVVEQIGSHADLLPTFCRIADIKTDGMLIDGIDITDAILKGENIKRDLFLYEPSPRNKPHKAFRRGPWKYADGQLYNLDEDISETTDVAEKYPEKLQELEKAHTEILKTLNLPQKK